MRHTFEEEFRLESPQWDFDNDILGPYTRWLEAKLLEARKQLALSDDAGQSEHFCECDGVQDLIAGTGECRKCGGQCTY